MAKSWQCVQCGYKVTTGIRDSLAGEEPERCDNCGHDEFEELRVTGTLHKAVEGPEDATAQQTTRRRALQAAGAGVAAAGGSWYLWGRPTVEETTEVEMRDAQFRPRNIEIDVGDTVTWENVAESGEGEDITYFLRSATDGWDFEADVPEESDAEHTFEGAGVYALYAEGVGGPDLSGMSMKIGVGQSIDDPLGGWF